MKQVYAYVIAIDGKYHSKYATESDAQNIIDCIEGNTTLTVVFHDGTGERIDKTKDQYFKKVSIK